MLDGSATSGKSRCNLRDVVNSDAVEREEVALFGMKRDLLQLISSLLYHCTKMQDKVCVSKGGGGNVKENVCVVCVSVCVCLCLSVAQ